MGKLYSIQFTVYSVQLTVYSLQYRVYSVQYKIYIKVVLLSLWREPQCSSVWGVKPFARLLFCLIPPEDFRADVGDTKWSEICLLGIPKWSEIWLSGNLEME